MEDEPLLSAEQRRGLRQCCCCWRWRPVADLERHTAGVEGTAEKKRRPVVWWTCREGECNGKAG